MVLTFTKYKEINSFGIQNILYFSIPLFFLHFTIYIFLFWVWNFPCSTWLRLGDFVGSGPFITTHRFRIPVIPSFRMQDQRCILEHLRATWSCTVGLIWMCLSQWEGDDLDARSLNTSALVHSCMALSYLFIFGLFTSRALCAAF